MDALDRREWIANAARIGVPLVVLAVLAMLIWRLASNTAGERREVAEVPVIALTPPPPPPPPPKERPPEPQKALETPEPTPQPKTNAPQKSDAPKQLTINGPAQAGTDAFGVAAGRGGGVSVGGDPNGSDTGGGEFAAANYTRYLNAALQQAIQSNDKVSRLFFTVQVRIWIGPDGGLTKVAIVKSSGDDRTDRALIAALEQIRRLDEAPPPQLKFPALVALRGRRA
ncbi:MAG: TonB family protein [Caulobacteraceae bacterium]|nr:TonB family protein [Caulobacteraceae bacterium]